MESRLAGGAWIETFKSSMITNKKRRASQGARGLKLTWQSQEKRILQSRLAGGAWIETTRHSRILSTIPSRLAGGAWIETV